MTENYILTLDVLATFFFSVSGTLIGIKQRKLDDYGIALVALITAVGGGTLRDMLLDAHPIAWVSNKEYLIAIIVGIAVARLLHSALSKFLYRFMYIDAVAVSFAALAGMEKSLEMGANPFAAVFLGVVTATFGGIIRDILCNQMPKILYTEVYATVVLVGCMVKLWVGHVYNSAGPIDDILAYLVIVTLRIASIRKNWSYQHVHVVSVHLAQKCRHQFVENVGKLLAYVGRNKPKLRLRLRFPGRKRG